MRRKPNTGAAWRWKAATSGRPGSPFCACLLTRTTDLNALRDLHRQLLQDEKGPDSPFFRDLGAVLHDGDAMLAIVHKAAADSAYRGNSGFVSLADALGEADLAATALREAMKGSKVFKEGHMDYGSYWSLWLAPYSGLRAHPEFKKLLIETGLADYWRQTGKWGDGCKPVGADDSSASDTRERRRLRAAGGCARSERRPIGSQGLAAATRGQSIRRSSTRRLRARPCAVSLPATGRMRPKPLPAVARVRCLLP